MWHWTIYNKITYLKETETDFIHHECELFVVAGGLSVDVHVSSHQRSNWKQTGGGRLSQIDSSTQPMTLYDDYTNTTNQMLDGRVHSPNFTRRAAGRNTENEYPGLNRFQPVRGWKHELRGRAHLHALKHLCSPTVCANRIRNKNETLSLRDYDPEYRSKCDSVNLCC